ncbi:MAG: peptidylprolyl isomerase [Desulfovibrio sp. MES5]|uniref:SurA N-terminal domain-containing protein n=1 Tax=Desulfovibrio sp. MES5 TaxID=1899016 RepID=UPI000B9C8027|nr:SurA N-terminal domain-containing protein [Desulfovibrio sp. MES5]OXS30259.1 MAG: peptidylprolyl isomerase [Desulfovibrio sp. MES5]
MRKILVLLLAIVLTTACSVQAAQLNKVAAVVNGQVITMFDLQKNALPDLLRSGLNPENPANAKQVDTVFRKVLDLMIMDILIAQEAKRLKVSVSPSEIDNEIAKVMQGRNMTKQQFEEQLTRQKSSVAELRANIEKTLLRQKIMGMEVGRKVVVTPEEIQAYYDAHKSTMYDRSGLHMGVLVYSPKVNAASIAAQIRSGALTFEEAALKYSIAPNKEKGGDMGPVEWDRLNPEWESRLTKMKPGDVTEIFDLQGHKAQVHLFRPGGSSEMKILTLEEAKPQIDAILRQPKAMERFDDYTGQLRKKAVIDIRL